MKSFHNRLRDECLNQEWFLSLAEARVVIENWRKKYNRIHPHSHLGFLSPDMFAKYWQQAKQRVLGSGQVVLASMYDQGVGVEASLTDAMKWYMIAFMNGLEGASKYIQPAMDKFESTPTITPSNAP